MKLKLFLIFIFSFFYSQSKYYYSIEQIFSYFNNLEGEENDFQQIIDCLCSIFSQAYAFNEVAKNPPQPDFDINYHSKVNIQEGLRSIQTHNTNFYEFYGKVKLLFDNLADQHLHLINNKLVLNDIYFSDPLKLSIKVYENKTRMFADIGVDEEDYSHFRNYETLFNIIKKNSDIPIKTINDIDPFDFITSFAGDYEKLKSPQGSFRYKFFEHNNNQNFFDYPISKENLINFKVVYENEDSFTTDYMIYSEKKQYNLQNLRENIKLFINNFKENEINNNLNKNFVFDNYFISLNEKIYKKILKMKNLESEKSQNNFINDQRVDWDFNYNNYIACRTDYNKKINIYAVTSFDTGYNYDYKNTIRKCTKLFDKNDFPIILINIFNGGGLVYNSQYLIELLSPKTELNIYGAYRKTEMFHDDLYGNALAQAALDIDDCQPYDYKSLMKSKNTINYGNSIKDTLLGPFILNGKSFRSEVNEFKENLKNPRKPTEILVYTDGFSYSATSLLLKYLQYYGGAITAGYFPNPNLESIPYDSSLSPSAIFTPEILNGLDVEGYSILSKKFNYNLILAGIQSFFNPNDLAHPLEYEITPVDEIVNIFFDKVYNKSSKMNAHDLDIFINDSLIIFEKYKTNCNPKNKKLLLISKECDEKLGSHAHGGYECGENGIWTNNCVASYCDIGYIYDHVNKKCYEDPCESEDTKKKFIILSICIIAFILLVILGICIGIYIKKKSRERRYMLNSLNNMNLEENLNANN